MTYSLNWDLDPIYQGGIESPEFADKLLLLAQQITDLKNNVAEYEKQTDHDFTAFAKLVNDNQVIFSGLRTAALFVNALSAADYTN
ncbi:M3 family oligoendopeptidase, partial [Aeromonas veronii]|uniref:M3 family oligoendopeptidase n=1 Tax=Aeromonas veronii TaxID=654 RepID=UPI0011168909